MIGFKECPRCHGDVDKSTDAYGPFWKCIQCGHLKYYSDEQLARIPRYADRFPKRKAG